MDKQKLGLILLILGIAVLAVSGLADVLGYGEGSFGPKQGVGVILGVIFLILGWLWRKGGNLALPGVSGESIEVESSVSEEVEISNE